MLQQITFPSGTVNYYFHSKVELLWELFSTRQVVLITDKNIVSLYPALFRGRNTIVLQDGEASKDYGTIVSICNRLIEFEATRSTLLIGIGGGVVTDITGFVASVYMRGVSFGFVPTSLLCMVDAAIGGKNGINLGLHKNMMGTINQPEFILYDTRFLKTLPDAEWSNGFAEIIKYGCIFDAVMFEELRNSTLAAYRSDNAALQSVIDRCVHWKNITVQTDEHEKGIRKLLNFGHTAGHAIETLYKIPHGNAVGIGMLIACEISTAVNGLNPNTSWQLLLTLTQYNLPAQIPISVPNIMSILRSDKKRNKNTIDYIVLTAPGDATIKPLAFNVIENALNTYESNN
jgi:3-dehydroquinate synthase